ncbi:PREDICTED: RNA/RNP complex-1-interacting phosphatase [Gekko japonicus]|uniref:RNA/RNP complex-1-interacting phosphatase n=1 Tax=Gekko japonicus TaxID=146911 RepID=A0ABM1KXT9_GEKJA|nr:PREDICTED: RNA/RNP complex-1-interacting phosphatase [Gekko japonicus]
MGKKSKTSIPERWTEYLPLGKRMPGTRFIAFKVPLQKSFEWRLAPNERFSPFDLVNQVREQEEELGLIIDLTYTTRYYEPEELPGSVQHYKIFTVGHDVPNEETVFQFITAVRQFLMENQHNDNLIGVHCTHGVNRTGYLICRYLIDVEGMDPNMALELFNSYRGHFIDRKNYIDDLRRGAARRNRYTAVYRWMNNELCGYAPSSGFQAADYNPRNLQQCALQEQRHILAGRGRVRQNPYRRTTQNQNTCYDSQSVYSPSHPPAPHATQQRWNRSRRPNSQQFDSSYQPHFQECEPSFPVQNHHDPLQHGRYSAHRQSSHNFY